MTSSNTRISKLRDILENEDTFATTLLAICVDAFGTEFFEYDPETTWLGLAEIYGAELPRANKDKIQAMTLVYTTDIPLISVEAFNFVCNVLSGSEANFKHWDPLSPEEAIWGIYEMLLHIGIDRDKNEEPPEFGHEVRRYLGIILFNDGIFDPPDILRIAEMPDRSNLDQWTDEPVIFNAVWDKAQTEKRALLEFLAARLEEMMSELNDVLPQLEHYDEEAWDKFAKAVNTNVRKIVNEHTEAALART